MTIGTFFDEEMEIPGGAVGVFKSIQCSFHTEGLTLVRLLVVSVVLFWNVWSVSSEQM